MKEYLDINNLDIREQNFKYSTLEELIHSAISSGINLIKIKGTVYELTMYGGYNQFVYLTPKEAGES